MNTAPHSFEQFAATVASATLNPNKEKEATMAIEIESQFTTPAPKLKWKATIQTERGAITAQLNRNDVTIGGVGAHYNTYVHVDDLDVVIELLTAARDAYVERQAREDAAKAAIAELNA